jgi:hypothetical protein
VLWLLRNSDNCAGFSEKNAISDPLIAAEKTSNKSIRSNAVTIPGVTGPVKVLSNIINT